MTALREFQAGFAATLFADAPFHTPALAIYRNNVRTGLARALSELYPVTAALLGADCFMAVADRYVAAHPPRAPVLIGWGSAFADLLATDEAFAALPYLPDVTRLEFALHTAYHAPDATPLRLCAFHALKPDILATLRLGLHPSAALVSSDYPVDAIWRAHRAADTEAALAAIAPGPARLLVARPRDEVELRALDAATFRVVAAFADGVPPTEPAILAALFDADLIVSDLKPECVP